VKHYKSYINIACLSLIWGEIGGQFWILRNALLFYAGHRIITAEVVESRMLQWIGHIAYIRARCAHIIFIGEIFGKLACGISRNL